MQLVEANPSNGELVEAKADAAKKKCKPKELIPRGGVVPTGAWVAHKILLDRPNEVNRGQKSVRAGRAGFKNGSHKKSHGSASSSVTAQKRTKKATENDLKNIICVPTSRTSK